MCWEARSNSESPDPADVQKWVADAQQGNYQIAQAQAAFQLSEQEVARNRGGHLPTRRSGGDLQQEHRRRRQLRLHRHAQQDRGRAAEHGLVPGRGDPIQVARGGRESREVQAGSGECTAQRRVANPPGVSGCGQRDRPSAGPATGVEVQRKSAWKPASWGKKWVCVPVWTC